MGMTVISLLAALCVLEKGYVAETNAVAAVEPVAVAAVETNAVAAVETNAVEPPEPVATNAIPVVTVEKAAVEEPAKKREARITADSTFYDRKEGVIRMDRNVFVDDAEYQLHADRAYVFLEGTNDVKRIVALGNVALTNEQRRAYGVKASYYREAGMVVLYGGTNSFAEVRDESAAEGARTVRGSKIKFWIGSEQVEVTGAEIVAPVPAAGSDSLKELAPGRLSRR